MNANASDAAGQLCGVVTGGVESVIVYGSAATGDLLPGYSDLDLLVVLRRVVTFDDAMDLHRRVVGMDVGPYAYVQPTFVLKTNVSPLLVPGTFVVLYGSEPPADAVQSDADLRRNGSEWLAKLPTLVSRDAAYWALAAVDIHRRARLALTRLKPAIRALLVRDGVEPMDAWSMAWDQMLSRLAGIDDEVHNRASEAIAAARSSERGPDDVGTEAMVALGRICGLLTDEASIDRLIIST